MKRLVFLLLLIGCTNHTSYLSSQSLNWCFITFDDFANFQGYLENHKRYAEGGNINSMKMLGCAYYQRSDLAESIKWLMQAHESGEVGAASALMAIYLKEGNIEQALFWNQHISIETDHVRWLRVIMQYEQYRQLDKLIYLAQAKDTLQKKMNVEGETQETENLLDSMQELVEQDQQCRNSDCSRPNFDEKRNYLNIFFKGAISTLVPSIPLEWHYDAEEMEDIIALEDTGSEDNSTE